MAARPSGPDRVTTLPSRDELRSLRDRLPASLQFGTAGWVFPDWAGIVWHEERSEVDLERDGLHEYASHPLLTAVVLEAGEDVRASERDLRRYAGQLPDTVHCIVRVHPEVTTPRFTHASRLGGDRAGQVNPNFLEPRFFVNEIFRTYQEVFAGRLGLFLLTFPPILARSGISPFVFAERLERFLVALPAGASCAVEIREPDLLSLPYAKALAHCDIPHVFTTHPGMPSVLAQARIVPTSPELIVRIVGSTRDDADRQVGEGPFNELRYPDGQMRDQVVELLVKMRAVPTYVLVDNEAEGCAPLTIVALARQVLRQLDAFG
jgi:uncharacterized protein YecE (DUF72 family)